MSRYLRIWGALDASDGEPDWRTAVPFRLNYVDPSDIPEEDVVYVAYDVPIEDAPKNIFRPHPRGKGWIVPYAVGPVARCLPSPEDGGSRNRPAQALDGQ